MAIRGGIRAGGKKAGGAWAKDGSSGTETLRKKSEVYTTGDTGSASSTFSQRFKIKNPLACFRIIFYFDTFLALYMHGSFYVVDYCLVAAVPNIYKNIYSFNELQIGLSYLPRGAGIILGGYFNGKLMDHNYKYTARSIGWTINRVSGDDLKDFPIERARSRGSFVLLIISTATLAGYGWAVSNHVHVSVPLILQFIQGFWGTCFYTMFNTLLVDIFPESPSTAAAAASVTRCIMAASGVAVLQPLLDAAGRGWYFTVLALWSGGLGVVAVSLIRSKSMAWRRSRLDRDGEV
jgi:MFS family permease